MSVAGLVLAAGAGRRFGAPKALLTRADGRRYVDHAVASLRDAGCDPVVVVVGAAGESVREHLAAAPVRIVDCPTWAQGMGESLRAGLAALDDLAVNAAVVTLVDLPDVGSDVVVRLVAASSVNGPSGPIARSALVRAAYGGRLGHPVVLGRDHWSGIREMAEGDRGARDYLATHPHRTVECGDLATGRDVDTPQDLMDDSGA